MVNTNRSKNIKSDKSIVRLLLGSAFSLFLLSEPTRAIFNKGSFNLSFNILFMVFGTLTILFLLFREYLDIRIVYFGFVFFGIIVISLIVKDNFIFKSLVTIYTLFVPFLLTAIRLPKTVFISFFKTFLKTINVVCLILISIGVLDYFLRGGIQVFLAYHHVLENDQARMALLEHASGIYRYYFFLGGPLENAWYMLFFYTLNVIYNRYFKPLLNDYLVMVVTLIGLLLCGSRSALIIALFMFVFLNNRKYKVLFTLIFSLIGLGAASTSLFQENLMKRFLYGSTSGDFSEGRNEAFSRVVSGFVSPPPFFTGGGLGYSREITLMMGGFIHSFEYPILMFSYDLGILSTILIYLLILFIPVLICLKNKTYFLLMLFLSLSLYVNGYNDLANYYDSMGQFCILIFIIVNMSYLIKERKEKTVE